MTNNRGRTSPQGSNVVNQGSPGGSSGNNHEEPPHGTSSGVPTPPQAVVVSAVAEMPISTTVQAVALPTITRGVTNVGQASFMPNVSLPARDMPFGMPTSLMQGLQGNYSTFSENIPPFGMPPFGANGTMLNLGSRMSPPTFTTGQSSQLYLLTGMNSSSLQAIRQQVDDSNHEMVNMLSRQMGEIINPLIQNTNANNQQLAHQMGRLATVLEGQVEVAPLPGIGPIPPVAVPARRPAQLYPNIEQNPLFEENGAQAVLQNPYVVNRNEHADGILERIRHQNAGGQQNVAAVVEQLLNQHGFNVGFANRPHFISAFTEEVLDAELPRGWKVPKFTKFSGDSGESTV